MSDQKENVDQVHGNVSQTSDQEIFEEATSDMPSPVPTPSEASPSEEKPGRLAGRKRDEKGRVLPKESEPEPTPTLTAPAEETPPEKTPTHQVPLTELLNERERRQNEQRQREALQAQFQALQRKLQEMQKPPEQPVDMFADPQAWEQTQQQRNEAWRRQVMGEMSLRLASAKYPSEFPEAYSAMQQRLASGDTALQQAFIASPDPGEMMVNWYRKEKTAQIVGTDPEDFLARALDAALENPEFLARAVEKARGEASTKPTQVKLPPSLSKATASSASADTSTDTSDAALYDAAWR